MLQTCLAALEAQTLSDQRVIVVDNGSDDGSVAWLRERHPSVRVIENAQNRGFAAPVNQGIEASDSPYVAVLNNDAEPSPGWLAALVQACRERRARRDVCVQDDVCRSAHDDQFDRHHAWIGSAIAWDRRGGETEDGRETEPVEVFGACAGAALYRREMLQQMGLFDEDFFAYLEDVDLAWRARRLGWRCLYVPAAHVLHRHSATGQEGSPFKSFHLGRNKVWMVVKNYPFRALWYAVPACLVSMTWRPCSMLWWRCATYTLCAGGWRALRRRSQDVGQAAWIGDGVCNCGGRATSGPALAGASP